MKKIVCALVAATMLTTVPAAFAKKSSVPKTHTPKKHSRTGQNRRSGTHKASDNIPSK